MSQISDDLKLNRFADILDSSGYIVFLGGAEVSTESGIPDFRSKNVKRISSAGHKCRGLLQD